MTKLSSPAFVSQLLERHGIRLKKKWGQNFLVDDNILQKIVDAAGLTRDDTVIEIGPGIGALTQYLAAKAGRVQALEIDGRLIPVLKETLAEYDNVTLLHQDAMESDWQALTTGSRVKIVANLPYNVATPLFYRWLKQFRSRLALVVCMVQKEVAERMTALPGSKEYGSLSVVCRYASETEMLFTVPRTVFFPRPDVSSAVVRLRPLPAATDTGDEDVFFKVVDAVFAQRRKTLLNTLHAAFPLDKDTLCTIGKELVIDMSRRGETLNVAEFAYLSRMIYNKTEHLEKDVKGAG